MRKRITEALGELGSKGSLLSLRGKSAPELLEQYGSPLYAYLSDVLEQRAERVQEAFGDRVTLYYAMKANPNVDVVRTLHEAGCGVEVASSGEIERARAAGVPGPQMQFAGPGKSRADLAMSVALGIGCLNLESLQEYEALLPILNSIGNKIGVAIRVNPEHEVPGSRMRMAGGSKKFGVDIQQVPALASRIAGDGRAELKGLHVYTGSQAFDAEAWLKSCRELLTLANDLEQELDYRLVSLNFGGGFGVPSSDAEPMFDLDFAGRGLQELIAKDDRSDRVYSLELGRYLVATAGVYLTKVLYLKESQGKRYAILDGGMHHFAAAAGYGSVLRRGNHPVVLCRDVTPHDTEPVTLAGPLCTPADELGSDVELPPLRQGDALAFLVAGAYGLSFSPMHFLGHRPPAEIVL